MAQLAVRFDKCDGQAVARVIGAELPEREIRRLVAWFLGLEEVVITCARDGESWTVDMGDEVGTSVFVDGGYASAEITSVLSRLRDRPGRTIVDVGANVGTTTIPLAKAGYSVVAIEPVPRTIDMLRRNLVDNGVADRVAIVPSAIATDDHVDMWVTRGTGVNEVAVQGQEPGYSIYGAAFSESTQRISVPAAGLAHVLAAQHVVPSDVAFVWSDTQGSEIAVLETGAELWQAGVPLYVEVMPSLLGPRGGVDRFLGLAEASFREFVPRDALANGAAATDIRELRSITERLDAAIGEFTDVPLIP